MQTISGIKAMGNRNKQAGRSRTGDAGQTAPRTYRDATHAFLRHSFTPLYHAGKKCPSQSIAQKPFFDALSNLSAAYQLQLTDYSELEYPYNVLLSLKEATQMLLRLDHTTSLRVIKAGSGDIGLFVRQYYNTNSTLYYIPVMPVYNLLNQEQTSALANLLIEVFAYLYKVARIPYYTQQGTYLSYLYDISVEWWREEDGQSPEFINTQLDELKLSKKAGKAILARIKKECKPGSFQRKLNAFVPKNDLEKEGYHIASSFLSLYKRYPSASIMDNIESSDADDEIGAHQYISFCANIEGAVFNQIEESIRTEFQECMLTHEPVIDQCFMANSAPQPAKTLDYEKAVFPLLHSLCAYLNQLS